MNLKEKLGKEFVVTCELGGTQGTDVARSLEDAESLSRADGINLIDCAMAKLRINTFALLKAGVISYLLTPHFRENIQLINYIVFSHDFLIAQVENFGRA